MPDSASQRTSLCWSNFEISASGRCDGAMNTRQDGITPNAARLLWAGFVAILATGVGFGVRGGILANWGAEFGFTGAELGAITGSGLTWFCFGVFVGCLVVYTFG